MAALRRLSTSVTITDPLVKYKSLVATGVYSPDPAQHRLARHLRDLYHRIKDYTPSTEYRRRLDAVAQIAESPPRQQEDDQGILALRHHAIWGNPLFKHLLRPKESSDTLALTRTMTSHESAMDADSPKGLFLSGEVGTGKSMLLDLLAEGLPTQRKRRWHFNTFMLHVLSQLEAHRKARDVSAPDYSLMWMAREVMEDSPILFLDEFQLPDRAASKILCHFFIGFFQLGGILIASSNRMPEELQNAVGVDYSQAPNTGLIKRLVGGAGTSGRGELFGRSSDFANFLDVLKARCDFWHMEGTQDWRRREEREYPVPREDKGEASNAQSIVHESKVVEGDFVVHVSGAGTMEEAPVESPTQIRSSKCPSNYHLLAENDEDWFRLVREVTSAPTSTSFPWRPRDIVVYGRQLAVPQSGNGTIYWHFDDLVKSFGPADYITLGSSYHTFIIDNVPTLSVLMKNEARRFITLLDALYEARCKLLVRAEQPPDELFFPARKRVDGRIGQNGVVTDDATYSETIAEVYQDQTSPFRPNISYYDNDPSASGYDPDQDSDFGLDKKRIDFGNAGAFTGEDERFAYKRAASRLWELCSARWHGRTGDWWQPLPVKARHWERGPMPRSKEKVSESPATMNGETMGDSIEIDEVAGLSRWRVMELQGNGQKGES